MSTSSPPPTPPSDDDRVPPRAPGSLFDSDLAHTVKQSAQQIWLAGLGAFAKAQEEGSRVFESLVREGTTVQRRTQATSDEDRTPEPAAPTNASGGGFASQATQQWDRLESIFEDRVAKALKRLGVPSLKEVAALEARIDELAAEVARLSGRASAPDEASADDGSAPGGHPSAHKA